MGKLIMQTENLYNELGLEISDFIEEESNEYNACSFKVNNLKVLSRKSKITPNKIGSFVTFWKRENGGPIMPYCKSDDFDFLVVNINSDSNKGQFIFSKNVLLKHNIISKDGIGGKRAFRLYSPWDLPKSNQAINSQKWQRKFFVDMSLNKMEVKNRVRELYEIKSNKRIS